VKCYTFTRKRENVSLNEIVQAAGGLKKSAFHLGGACLGGGGYTIPQYLQYVFL